MLDRYVRENIIALAVFADDGQSEFNGIDGRTLHAFARRGLVWFEAVDPFAKSKRYRGGLTDKGRSVLAEHEAAAKAADPIGSRSQAGTPQLTEADVITIDGVLDDGWAHDGEQDLCPSCAGQEERDER